MTVRIRQSAAATQMKLSTAAAAPKGRDGWRNNSDDENELISKLADFQNGDS